MLKLSKRATIEKEASVMGERYPYVSLHTEAFSVIL